MTTASEWLEGARPRTLPAALAPVLVGCGVAVGAGRFTAGRAVLALVVALALQVGVNYANDYSDGIRGTDAPGAADAAGAVDAVGGSGRVGPMRLVGSGTAPAVRVRTAALLAFSVAAVAGLVLAALTTWILVAVGAAAVVAAWTYTGGPRPYGYAGFGELFVFVFFGLVAVVGTAYVQTEDVTGAAVLGGVANGLLACALLLTNNLRDLPGDRVAGKRTLSVRLGAAVSRRLYVGLLAGAFVVPVLLAAARPAALLALVALPLALPPVQAVRAGAAGRALLPVLAGTGRLQLAFGALLALGLALG